MTYGTGLRQFWRKKPCKEEEGGSGRGGWRGGRLRVEELLF
jgi:hypothetical protein